MDRLGKARQAWCGRVSCVMDRLVLVWCGRHGKLRRVLVWQCWVRQVFSWQAWHGESRRCWVRSVEFRHGRRGKSWSGLVGLG